jgi:hypothetical protein
MCKRFKSVLGFRVALPFHFILGHSIHNLLANNGFYNVLSLAFNNSDGRWPCVVSRKREGVGVEALELGDVEDGVNLHPRCEVQLVGDRGDDLYNFPGALVLETELGREVFKGQVLGREEDLVPNTEGVVTPSEVGIFCLAVLGGT